MLERYTASGAAERALEARAAVRLVRFGKLEIGT
jgi:hypothetical protein